MVWGLTLTSSAEISRVGAVVGVDATGWSELFTTNGCGQTCSITIWVTLLSPDGVAGLNSVGIAGTPTVAVPPFRSSTVPFGGSVVVVDEAPAAVHPSAARRPGTPAQAARRSAARTGGRSRRRLSPTAGR